MRPPCWPQAAEAVGVSAQADHTRPALHFSAQFGFPRGRLGRLAGAVMALENRRANRLVLELLDLQPDDYVLEVGCGPGVALAQAARMATFAVGADPSEVMVAQARRRCRAAIRAERAEVITASASELPFDDDFFTCAFAVHTMHHWPCLADGLLELHRVIEPAGRVALAGRVERPGRDPHANGAGEEELGAFAKLLAELGFTDIARSDHDLGRETLAVFRAHRRSRCAVTPQRRGL
jgi:SAM-dependent methyltransferase